MKRHVFKFNAFLIVALFAASFVSCDNDNREDEPDSGENGGNGAGNSVSSQTLSQIREIFAGNRLDSISSNKDYCNIKMVYDGDLLTMYKECYDNGSIHDNVVFALSYAKDTVFIRNAENFNDALRPMYKAVIGSNGLVSKLICPSGKVNKFEYDNENRIIKYYHDISNNINYHPYKEVIWENGNVSRVISHFQYAVDSGGYDGGIWHERSIYYTYNNIDASEPYLNKGSILPVESIWFSDSGRSMAYGVYDALYYAGLVGKGTANLPVKCVDYNTHSIAYTLDSSGYISSATSTYQYGNYSYIDHVEEYFYR